MKNTMTQKELAKILDRAAARAEIVNRAPATGKQCWFLAKLILESGTLESNILAQYDNTNYVLTCKQASVSIDGLLKEKQVINK